ncbi:Scytalone deHydratase Arp1 [Hyphodiscus hymeniophilus]|uniref:Scytalone deHydratase Arp1 n=1 Tax=Hyphodiscus hymeniophilus TaxID=353542 RepID=A0A9P7AZN4_9HELO|nr:Scytalone deHydratase Arp1 [Hyphodiscus hymeniophilus]
MTCQVEQVCSVGSSRYLIGPKSSDSSSMVEKWPIKDHHLPLPVTIISIEGLQFITSSWLQTTIDDMLSLDDVFCEDFLSCILFQDVTQAPHPRIIDDGDAFQKLCPNWHFCTGRLRPGPYIQLESGMHKVFKLCSDPNGAFVYGVVESEDNPESYRRVLDTCIPIPSRHYFPPPSPSAPLSGKRVAVKDIYDICGLKTGIGSKAYESFQQEATKTATSIQQLISLGAVIIGKTKTVQFASGMAPRDWIDYQCPFNPRGDGYLSPDCSSSGSAVAIASYNWVDFSIGSDTLCLGSMVGPAAACGIFGLRPSHGALSNVGALAVSALLDTPGHFSRDISDFGDVARSWLGSSYSDIPFKLPKRLLVPRAFSHVVPSKLKLMNSFVGDLEILANIKSTYFDIDELWRSKAHISKPFFEYFASTLAHIQLHDSWHNNLAFRAEYKAIFGEAPYVDPLIQYKWDLGSELTESQYRQACEEKSVLKQFLGRYVFTEGTVLLLASGDADISYRDDYVGETEMLYDSAGWDSAGNAGSLTKADKVEVGQRSYDSRVTGNEEYQPVSLMLLAQADEDRDGHLSNRPRKAFFEVNWPLYGHEDWESGFLRKKKDHY